MIEAMPLLVLGTMAAFIVLNIGVTELSKLLPASIADFYMWPNSPRADLPQYLDFIPIQALQIP